MLDLVRQMRLQSRIVVPGWLSIISVRNAALSIPTRDPILNHSRLILTPNSVTDQPPVPVSLPNFPPEYSVARNATDTRVFGFLRPSSQVLLDVRAVRLCHDPIGVIACFGDGGVND